MWVVLIHTVQHVMQSKIGLRILTALALLLPGLAFAEAQPTFAIIRDGLPSSMSPAQFDSAREGLRQNLGQVRAELIRQALPLKAVETCRRYSAATQNVMSQLKTVLGDLHSNASLDALDDQTFLLRERFELLFLAYMNLYNMFSRQEEGGDAPLEPTLHIKCGFENRAALGQQLAATKTQLFEFYRDGFGVPGLLTLDRASDRLLHIAKDVAFQREMVSYALAISSIVFMPTVWKSAPMVIESVVTRFAGRMPAILLRRDVARSIGLLGVSGEGVGFNFLNEMVVPEEDARRTDFLIGWRDRMKEIEALVHAPLDFAELDFAYLGQQKNILAESYQTWLRANAASLAQTYGSRFTETLALINEFQLLNNAPVEAQIDRSKKILLSVYGYQVSCDNAFWNSVSDVQCLMALRKFARAAYSGDLPHLDLSTQEALTFVLTNKTGDYDFRGEPMTLSLNTRIDPAQLREDVQTVLAGTALRTRLFDNQQFANLRHDFEVNTGLTVSVDSALNHIQRWRSLMTLTELAKADPLVMNLGADEIHLGPDFRDFDEHGLKMRLTLSANAHAEQMKAYLLEQAASPHRVDLLQNFESRRQDLRTLVDQVKASKLNARCSEVGELTLDGCVYALVQIVRAIKRNPPILPASVKTVIVLNQDDLPLESTIFQSGNAKVWAVRNDVTPAALARFLQNQGWLHD